MKEHNTQTINNLAPVASGVVPFQFGAHAVRVLVTDDGSPLFVARDVAAALGYEKTANAVANHCKRAKSLIDIGSLIQGPQQDQALSQIDPQTKLIPESDVYRLVMRSKLEGAERFQDWVVEDVLPAIRKTGKFESVPQPAAAHFDPASITRLQLIQMALESEQERLALEQQVAVIQPKAAALDRLATASEGAMNVTAAAKHLQLRPKALFQWLNAHEWIYRRPGSARWLAYQTRLQAGLLEHKVATITREDGSEKVVEQVLITAKGLSVLAQRMGGNLLEGVA